MAPTADSGLPQNRWRRLRLAFRWIERTLALVGLTFLVYASSCDLSRIVSGSMAPTLQGTKPENGDLVLSEHWTYRLRRPRRWELIAFYDGHGQRVMKRVVGLPGEQVSLGADGVVWIDGAPQPLPANMPPIKYLRSGALGQNSAAACGKGYYVLGDDTIDSDDSRYNGPIGATRIIGRPWLIVAPWRRLGFVNP